MKILVLGNGQMGAAVKGAAVERGHVCLGPFGRDQAQGTDWTAADVVVDFSVGSAVMEHVEQALAHGKPLVVGTTAWAVERDRVLTLVDDRGGTMIWGANFSVGFHALAELTRVAAHWAKSVPDLDVAVFEHHHSRKRDAPSGSALVLAKTLTEVLPNKSRIETDRVTGSIDSDALHVASLRAGAEPGLHRVHFEGPFDSVVLEHRVRDRRVFAAGAVFAAEQAIHKSGAVEFSTLVSDSMRGA